MSKELMAECLEEATDLLAKMFPDSPESLDPMVTIAVALYQERMRKMPRRGFPLGVGWGDTNLGTGGVK